MSIVSDNSLFPFRANSELRVPEREYFVGASPEIRALERATKDVAGSGLPVLILGEPGTGKKQLAVRIHEWSGRGDGSLCELDCKALHLEDFESQNFAPTSPAGSGTLIFREVSLLSAQCQAKLNEYLMNRSQIDGTSVFPRLIFTTRASLSHDVRVGRFREDLYYRISSVCLRIPPLRHRKEDVAILMDRFLDKYSALLQRPKPVLSTSTLRFLDEYGWPGNVRELEDAARTIAAVGDERVALASLKPSARVNRRQSDRAPAQSLKEASKAASRAAEKDLILRVLSRTRWNRKRAAEELKISYKALLYKLKEMGVQDPITGSTGEEL